MKEPLLLRFGACFRLTTPVRRVVVDNNAADDPALAEPGAPGPNKMEEDGSARLLFFDMAVPFLVARARTRAGGWWGCEWDETPVGQGSQDESSGPQSQSAADG